MIACSRLIVLGDAFYSVMGYRNIVLEDCNIVMAMP